MILALLCFVVDRRCISERAHLEVILEVALQEHVDHRIRSCVVEHAGIAVRARALEVWFTIYAIRESHPIDQQKPPAGTRVIGLGKVASGRRGHGAKRLRLVGSLIGAFGGVTTFENWQNFFRGGLSHVLYGPYPHEKETLIRVGTSELH